MWIQLLTYIVLLLAIAFGREVLGAPERPQPARTVRQICTSAPAPNWCVEYLQDLAHGRKEVKKACTTDRDCAGPLGGRNGAPF